MTTTKKLIAYHINRLKDKNPESRLKSISELKEHADLSAVEPLQELYLNDDEEAVRRAALEASRNILTVQLTAEDADVQMSARALVRTLLLNQLKDEDPQLRLKAIEELRQLSDSETLEALQGVFASDEDAEVRKAAQDAGRDVFKRLAKQK